MTSESQITYELSLFDNAIDYLNQSFHQYELGSLTGGAHLKYAITNFSQFLELICKHLLIVDKDNKPSSDKIQKMDFQRVLEQLRVASQHPLPQGLFSAIENFKNIRNKIGHSEVEIKPYEVRGDIAAILGEFAKYTATSGGFDLAEKIAPEHRPLFKHLCDSEAVKLKIAQDKALELSEAQVAYGCYHCGQNRVAARLGNKVVCQYCGHEKAAA